MSAASDSVALAAAASAAEEALGCHREALILIAEGWDSETGSAVGDLVQRQCAHGTDVVAALRRAAGGLAVETDLPARPADDDARRSPPTTVDAPVDTPPAPPPPAPVTAPAPGAPATPWPAPLAGPLQSPSAPLGAAGLPALADLGGALVGLIAQIAQTLGSYAEDPPPAPGDPMPAADQPTGPDPAGTTAAADQPTDPEPADPPDPPPATAPAAVAPLPPPPPAPPAPPPDLLAAERPPDPAAPAPAAPAAPDPAPAAPPAEPAQPAAVPAPAPDPRTACEIAADELPMVGG